MPDQPPQRDLLRSPSAMARAALPAAADRDRRLYARGVRDARRELASVVNAIEAGQDVDANLLALRRALLGEAAPVATPSPAPPPCLSPAR